MTRLMPELIWMFGNVGCLRWVRTRPAHKRAETVVVTAIA
ncbi:hypothetical protein FHS36_005263 [Streptomyces eurocidicus]|uniref:Uncharacterized protein n=1 Tax=Streptomyces eurocidicus TaxID=66423 RepID=A0A7W8BEA7_STREU|nr:hypothetical protein [Streptomyces eurocidicus]